jgi:carboxymethylenebutenolidase
MTRLMRIFGLLATALLLSFTGSARADDIAGRKLVLPARERQVEVTYFRAPGDGRRPAVLLLHGANGFDSQIASYNHYASELAGNGIDAYLVYYYSDADEKNLSGGEDIFAKRYPAWTRLVGDLADYLRKQNISNGKVGLVGFSNGGILATGASARDTDIGAAVIYYGTQPFPMDVPVKRFAPLLILHGDTDQIISIEQGRRLAALAKEFGTPAELVVYPGERHGFGSRLQTANGADALSRTIAFLRRELIAP